MFELHQCECLKCGHKWVPRTSDPKQCPGCQNRNWKKPKKKKEKNDGVVQNSGE